MKNSTILFVALLALAATGCQSDDLPPQPGYVLTGHDRVASVAPSVTGTGHGAMAANSSRFKDRRYFIEFRSRYALSYGHTYVVFGRVNEAGRVSIPKSRAFTRLRRAKFLMFWAISCRCPPKPAGATATWKNNTGLRVGA